MSTSGAEEGGRAAPAILALITLILFTDIMSYDMVVPLLPDYARMWGIGQTGLGLLSGTYGLAQLLTVPLGAWVCDRLGAVRGLRLGAAGLFLSQFLCAIANGRVMLFAARALHGAAGGAVSTAGLALLASAFPAGQRGRALGTAMAGMSLGPLVGLPLGGLLFTRVGPRCPFFVSSAWTLLLVVGLAWLPSRLCRGSPRTRRRPLSAWAAYLRPASAVVLGSALLSSLELTLPLHLEEMLAATPEQTGLLLGLAALLYGLAAPLAGWASDRWGGWRVLAAGLAACTVALPLLAVPRSWGGEVVALLVFGVACAFLLSPTLPEIAAACERQGDRSFGSAYAVFNLSYAVGMAAGPIASGVLKPALGFGLTLVTLSAVAALSLFFLAVPPPERSPFASEPSPRV
ncbi:MAG: MFS transporter [Planctomycetes bacterium]|nr:MFS transporter [Planctomycetota bacterium]